MASRKEKFDDGGDWPRSKAPKKSRGKERISAVKQSVEQWYEEVDVDVEEWTARPWSRPWGP